VDPSAAARARWNEKHRHGGPDRPSEALGRHLALLTPGRALDVAGGTGANARLLAGGGWRVVLLDLSDEAVRRARRSGVRAVQADALRLPFRGPFETVIVCRFLERSIARELVRLLAPGGTLYAEQFARGVPEPYLVRPGEFPGLFPELEPRLAEDRGDRSVFIGRRPGV
jgi:SAM-dependent methyltransferase